MRICLSHVGEDKLRGVNASGRFFFTCGNGEFIESRVPPLQNYMCCVFWMTKKTCLANIKKHPLITQLLLLYNYSTIIELLGKLIRKGQKPLVLIWYSFWCTKEAELRSRVLWLLSIWLSIGNIVTCLGIQNSGGALVKRKSSISISWTSSATAQYKILRTP